MGKATNKALAGSGRSQRRAVAAGAEDAERDLRLTAAAAEAKRALALIESARERTALAIAADRATERDEVAAAEAILQAAVRRAAAERLTVAQVAELVGLPAPGVRRILRTAAAPREDPSIGSKSRGDGP